MNIEQALTRRVPAAAKLHTARSRNDQVATDLRLFLKDACARPAGQAPRGRARAPGGGRAPRRRPDPRLHPPAAGAAGLPRPPSSRLDRDARARPAAASPRSPRSANWCPLGSGAIAGTTLPIDRELTARLLGFVDARGRPQVTQNSMDAVADRDLRVEFAAACALAGVHFSRIAEDLILWSSAEFGFVAMPDAFATGSSLMPQKKNSGRLRAAAGQVGPPPGQPADPAHAREGPAAHLQPRPAGGQAAGLRQL